MLPLSLSLSPQEEWGKSNLDYSTDFNSSLSSNHFKALVMEMRLKLFSFIIFPHYPSPLHLCTTLSLSRKVFPMSSKVLWLIGITMLCQVSTPSAQSSGDPVSTMIALYVVGSVVSLLVLVGIGIFAYKCAKRAAPGVVRELRNISTPPPAPNTVPPVWEVDAPTMEKFLQEIAEERPVRFTAQQLFAFTSNYSTRLGSGGFGEVYKGQFPNGVKIAVKVLKRGSDKKAEGQFMAEVGAIARTYHINLVRLYGFCYDQFMSALVLEYMENGSLDNFLFGRKEIQWEKLHDIAVGTARGIAYLHEECERRIIHYDIKPANILLDSNFLPKVGDFGLSNLCNRDNTHISVTGYRGTPGYSAPEFLTFNFPITFKCDVYSFGMVLFEIVGRKKNANVSPSGSLHWFPKQVWDHFEKGELAEITISCAIEEKDREKASRMCKVALWCVQDSPEDRPPMSTVVKMLEGGIEIMPPPKPFHYMYPNSTGDNAIDSERTSSGSSHSAWYRESTPMVSKQQVQNATQR